MSELELELELNWNWNWESLIGPIILLSFLAIKLLSVVNSFYRAKRYRSEFEDSVGDKDRAAELINAEKPKVYTALAISTLVIALPLIIISIFMLIF